jgi:PAS domain-containing protein
MPDLIRCLVVHRNDLGRTPLAEKRVHSLLDEVAAARRALDPSEGRQGRRPAVGAAVWHWDLASGTVEWDESLKAHFGHAETLTDAAWRPDHIHPEDRARVEVSLQRATIANHGAVWSDRYRFRLVDGSYVTVTERAYVVHDDAGPRRVLGAITPESAVVDSRRDAGRGGRPDPVRTLMAGAAADDKLEWTP